MFGQNDKLTLMFINARDIDGNVLPFQLKLPLSNECVLPDDIASFDLFEYHEGLVNGGSVVFSIYIGKITSINNLVSRNAMSNVKIARNIEISSIDSPICVQNVSGKQIVFATLNENDIVVGNKEKLKEVIEQLSDNFKAINNSVEKIRILSKKNK